jgi:hypothetical protein
VLLPRIEKGRTWLYEATVRPNAVLAYLERRGEGWTVVINPAGLAQIKRREELLPPVAKDGESLWPVDPRSTTTGRPA